MDGYVAKPIQARELFTAIAALVPRVGAEEEEMEVWDRSAALACVRGDEELLQEIAGLFLEDCPQKMAELAEAVAKQDARRLRLTAHTLKGALVNFGAREAYEAALRLETMGRQGDLARAGEALAALEAAVGRLRPVLEALAKEGGKG
jgi:HPt (histidine-containing phosphotransfer) domain-containing protein